MLFELFPLFGLFEPELGLLEFPPLFEPEFGLLVLPELSLLPDVEGFLVSSFLSSFFASSFLASSFLASSFGSIVGAAVVSGFTSVLAEASTTLPPVTAVEAGAFCSVLTSVPSDFLTVSPLSVRTSLF